MSTPYHVETNRKEGFIRIARHSREMLYWDSLEWEESPDVVFSILEWIDLATNKPQEMDAQMVAMGKINGTPN